MGARLRRAVRRDLQAELLGKAGGVEESRVPAAARDVDLQAVDRVRAQKVEEVGGHEGVLAGRDVELRR